MSKNDPLGKAHATVTPTSSQPKRAGTYGNNESTSSGPGSPIELRTPKNFLSGLSGVLADCAANDSASTSVGSGKGTRTQSMRAGVDGGVSLKPSKSSSTNFGK